MSPSERPVPMTLVVMGVAGVGKSAVAEQLAEATGWPMAEGDDFHSPANIATMAAGKPLEDDDRWAWLRSIADWIGAQERTGLDSVVTCSALRRSYRDLLRDGHSSVRFCELVADPSTLRDRLDQRRGHFLPASLLDSQLATLEPLGADEPGVRVRASGDVAAVVARVTDAMGLQFPSGR